MKKFKDIKELDAKTKIAKFDKRCLQRNGKEV